MLIAGKSDKENMIVFSKVEKNAIRYMKIKTLFSLIFLWVHVFSSAMNEDLKGEVKALLKREYAIEDIALLTFKPPHEEMSCMQSSLVSGIRIYYYLGPFKPYLTLSLIAGTVAAAATSGDPLAYPAGFIMALPTLYASNLYPMDECMELASWHSNRAAQRYLPEEFKDHVNACKKIKTELQNK